MTQEEKKTFLDLIEKIKSENLLPPNMPFELWRGIHSIMNLPTVEVLITKSGTDFLLVERHDDYWDGWHIPGGFLLYKEPIEEACKRIAKKELGIDINLEGIVTAFTWPDHPYGGTISIVCKCTCEGEPSQGQFFATIPDKMIPHHREFIQEFLKSSL